MDNYNNLRRIALEYNFNNITHFLMINNLINDKFIEITNNEFIKLNINYIIDHYTNITKTKHVIFILSQDMNDYIICYYNNHNEIIIDAVSAFGDVLLENESFLTNVINILRSNNFKKILYINDHYDDLLYKNILCYKSSIYYKNNFRYINELDNERSQYNIDKLDNLIIKDIRLDRILDMINDKSIIDIYSDCDISEIIDDIIDYYNKNLDKNICELFKYIRSKYDEIYHDIYEKIYIIMDLYKLKTKHMYLDL